MKELLKHKTNWLTRMIFILASLFVLQNSILAASTSKVNLGLDPHNLISEIYVYDEIESSSWVEVGLRQELSKNKVGSDCEGFSSVECIAAKGGTKLLSQFSKSTIDDAAAYAMRTQNNINHIFAEKHNLGSLVNKLGGQRNTINAILNAGNGRFPTSGVFKFPVSVGGQNVWIKGVVQNGMPKLGTMWIP